MTEADVDAVHAIEAATFPRPWSRMAFAQEVGMDRRVWLVADEEGEVLGYAGAALVMDEAHIMNLAVRSDVRHRGLGCALLAELADRVRALGATHLTLEVRESNSAARTLYEMLGLHEVGRRRGYYPETGEDALIMTGSEFGTPAMEARMALMRERGAMALEHFDLAQEAGSKREAYDKSDAGAKGAEELVLGIETSCDETAAAVLRGGSEVLSDVVASQVDFHARFGGVVPEIASRKHTEAIVGVVEQALEEAGVEAKDLDAIAVTYGPGLVGALVVGVAFAKALSFATGVPLVGVNHLEGHIFANLLAEPDLQPPLMALVVSGGHTALVHVPEWGEYRTLGSTIDDAAGEAFDKVAKVLGLGYPGGPVLSRLAEEGDPDAIRFPRAMMRSGDYDFSLSGLKTAVIDHIRHEREAGHDIDLPDLTASFQQAVIDVQIAKSVQAALETGVKSFCLAGGVAANTALREGLREALTAEDIRLVVPSLELCTDNATMIASAGTFRFRRGERLPLDSEALPTLRLDQ